LKKESAILDHNGLSSILILRCRSKR